MVVARKSLVGIRVFRHHVLDIGEEVCPFICVKVGNAQTTNFWFDNWVFDQPLSNSCSYMDIKNMGSSILAKVADFYRNGAWEWPSELLRKFPVLQEVRIQLSDARDLVEWKSISGKKRLFSVHRVWEDLRPRTSTVLWWPLVWFSKSIPKHSLTLWLAIRDRLLTQEQLKDWKIQQLDHFKLKDIALAIKEAGLILLKMPLSS
ncbi:hypothetical protein AgCh_023705 [Apium graveolens]